MGNILADLSQEKIAPFPRQPTGPTIIKKLILRTHRRTVSIGKYFINFMIYGFLSLGLISATIKCF